MNVCKGMTREFYCLVFVISWKRRNKLCLKDTLQRDNCLRRFGDRVAKLDGCEDRPLSSAFRAHLLDNIHIPPLSKASFKLSVRDVRFLSRKNRIYVERRIQEIAEMIVDRSGIELLGESLENLNGMIPFVGHGDGMFKVFMGPWESGSIGKRFKRLLRYKLHRDEEVF